MMMLCVRHMCAEHLSFSRLGEALSGLLASSVGKALPCRRVTVVTYASSSHLGDLMEEATMACCVSR